jgi:hypothetical protein
MGVGNSCGVGNNAEASFRAEEKIMHHIKKSEENKKKGKRIIKI